LSALLERASRIAKSWDALAVLFVGLWPFVFYWPVTLGQQVFYANDIFRLFFPLQTELARALSEGRLPLWTPDLQGGFPLFAEGEIGALYPFNWVFHALFPVSTALSYSILFHLAWASIGMYFLGRSAGLRAFTAWLGSFCFGFSGFVTAHLQHAPHLAVGSWLPWLVLFQQRYWHARLQQQKSVPWFLLSSLAIGLQLLGGFPQIALLNIGVFVLLGIFGPVVWSRAPNGFEENQTRFTGSQFAQAAFITISSVIIGTGLAAIQLLPTMELLGFSIRGQELGMSFFTSFSLDPSALTQFISPFAQLGMPGIDNMEYWAYLGVLPLFLALIAPLLRRKAQTWLFLLLALSSLALALGQSNPVYEWLYYVPLFNRLRVPARFLFPFTFASSFLAATGFQELADRLHDSATLARVSIAIGAIIALGAIGVIALGYGLPSETWMDAWHWLPIFFVLFSAMVILSAWLRLVPQRMFKFATIGLTILDLTFFSIPFLNLNRTVPSSNVASVPRTVQTMDNAQSIYRVFSAKPPASDTSARATLWPNFSLQFAKQGIGIYAPLEFQRVNEYTEEMTPAMIDLMNTRYYLLPVETLSTNEPSPFDETEPESGLTMTLLKSQVPIPLMHIAQIEITSYADQTEDLPNGYLAGQLILGLDDGTNVDLPIRLGIETADWAYDAMAEKSPVNHSKPNGATSFPAYLSSLGHEFSGHKYIVHYVAPSSATWHVKSIGVRSFLPTAHLTIERVLLIDEQGHTVSLASLLQRNDMTLVFRSHTAAMWENHSALSRAFMVHAAEAVSDGQALAKLQQPDFQPDQVVLLAGEQAVNVQNGPAPRGTKDQVTIADYEPERVVVKANAASGGYLLLTDSWYPGWEASVDGKSTPIYRADYIFRAVQVQSGEHTVVFEYRPLSFAIGTVISGLSLIICVLLAITSYFRPSRRSARRTSAEAARFMPT
jgi:hypothetical protein